MLLNWKIFSILHTYIEWWRMKCFYLSFLFFIQFFFSLSLNYTWKTFFCYNGEFPVSLLFCLFFYSLLYFPPPLSLNRPDSLVAFMITFDLLILFLLHQHQSIAMIAETKAPVHSGEFFYSSLFSSCHLSLFSLFSHSTFIIMASLSHFIFPTYQKLTFVLLMYYVCVHTEDYTSHDNPQFRVDLIIHLKHRL